MPSMLASNKTGNCIRKDSIVILLCNKSDCDGLPLFLALVILYSIPLSRSIFDCELVISYLGDDSFQAFTRPDF